VLAGSPSITNEVAARVADPAEWEIVFYRDEQGSSPIREFISSLDQKTQARLEWSLEQLRIRNVQAREPLVRHIEGKLWELREESRTNIYRFFYFFFTGRRIIIVHAFQKKQQRTPQREIEIAIARMNTVLAQVRGEKDGTGT
jgi:phage-related protein